MKKEDVIREWYRWFPEAWRDSERAMKLSLAEQGACRNLYDAMWQRGGKLPNDDRLLWRFAGAASIENWQEVRDAVLLMFEFSDDGKAIFSERLLKERRKSLQLTQIRRDAGKQKASKCSTNAQQVRRNSSANDQQVLGLRSEVLGREKSKSKTTSPPQRKATAGETDHRHSPLVEFITRCQQDFRYSTSCLGSIIVWHSTSCPRPS